MRDISDKSDNTAGATGELSAAEYNDHKNELQESVDRSGQTVSDTKTPDQLGRAMFINGVAAHSMQDSGTANSIVLTPVTGASGLIFPETLAELSGAVFCFEKSLANTSGVITVNVGQDTGSLLPAKNLVLVDASNPEVGTITGELRIAYSLSNDRWELMSQGVLQGANLTPSGADERWDETEAVDYETAGFIVERFGRHYSSSGLAGNLDKDPIDPQNADYWYPSPGTDELIERAMKGLPVEVGMHPVDNIQDANYQTSMLLDKRLIGGTTYEFYRVAMDGSVVTGDATLEAIFDPGGAKEYPFIDLYAPDNVGTRTLIDIQGRSLRSMTGGGGVAATLGEVQDDAMQRITGGIAEMYGRSGGSPITGSGVFSGLTTVSGNLAGGTATLVANAPFDNSNSISPNAAKTDDVETRVKAIVVGIDYIVVMTAA